MIAARQGILYIIVIHYHMTTELVAPFVPAGFAEKLGALLDSKRTIFCACLTSGCLCE